MDAEGREKMKALFEEAMTLPPTERAAFLDEACAGDAALRAELASLLDAYDDASGYFDDLADALFAPASAAPQAPGASLIGRHVSHYLIQEKLGGGGMGVVYQALDTKLDRTVALKFLPPYLSADEEAKQRFVHEAKAASSLDHPNIGTIHEIDETDDGLLFIAMTYYRGETLKAKIARGPLPVDEALNYALQMAEGLARAHEAGIVHRDVKPANVMVTERGRVKVVDFGLAKVQDVSLTRTGSTVGTVSYMSPEQASGKSVDHRTDVWSLGVVLYEMLTGERPFKGEYEQAVIYAVLNEEPEPVTALRPDVPEAVRLVIETLLEKDPANRTPSASQLIEDLARADGVAIDARLHAPRAPKRFAWPGRAVAAAAALAAALLIWWGLGIGASTSGEGDAVPIALDAIAVLPFSVQGGEDLAYLREGMVTLLGVKLDGTVAFRSVDPYALLSYLDGHPGRFLGPEEGRRIAAVFRAGRYILGSVTRAGTEVHLDARLYDTDGNEKAAGHAVFAAEGDFIPALDDLAQQLVADELEASGLQLASLAGSTTRSFEALKAYTQGEQARRRGLPARELALKALDLDSTFALAWYLLALDYAGPGDLPNTFKALRRAQAHAEGVPERLRLLIDATFFQHSDQPDEAERIFRQVLDRYPSDLHALNGLADVLYHYNPIRGRPAAEALPYLHQVLLYDEDDVHFQDHQFTELMRARDYEAVDTLILLFGPRPAARRQGMRWAALQYIMIRGTPAERDSLYAVASPGDAWQLTLVDHFVETQEFVRQTSMKGPAEKERWLQAGRWASARASFTLGQVRAATQEIQRLREATSDRYLMNEIAWALAPFSQASDEEVALLERRIAQLDTTDFGWLESRGLEPVGTDITDRDDLTRLYLSGLLQWRRGDAQGLEQTTRRLEAGAAATALDERAQSYLQTLKALAAWHQGRSAEALALIEAAHRVPNWVVLFRSYPRSQVFNRYVRAELLYELGRYEEALGWFGAVYDGFEFQGFEMLPYTYLRRAQIYEHLGETDEAIDFYRRFLDLWKDADAELHPWLEVAEEGLERVLERGVREPGAVVAP